MSFVSNFTYSTMNRSELQQQLVNEMIDGMDHKTMWQILDSYMMESYDKYSDSELMEEVKEYYPHLLEEETDFGALEATAPDYGVGK